MKYVGKAETVAQTIVDAFKTGDLPKALAPVFVHRKDGLPCRVWSWGNQLLCILSGTHDARGIKQWNAVGRKIKKGSKCFDILVPLMRTVTATDPDTGQEKRFKSCTVLVPRPSFHRNAQKAKRFQRWTTQSPCG